MEASTSSAPPHHPPATPSHQGLLPALSPAASIEATPAPLHTLPPHLQHAHHTQPPPRMTPAPQPGKMQPPPSHHKHHLPPPQMHIPPPQNGHAALPPGMQGGMEHQNVFGSVMGSAPGHVPQQSIQGASGAKMYASVYSGIPVFEAMIRGISVMRRSSDSWVNATQILKVAGIPKSARTKILEKEILTGVHEKVQGGYGKYQGTWIPFPRGQELAAQYGVTAYLAPIFDFVPTPNSVAALPMIRHDTPDRSNKGGLNSAMHYTSGPAFTPTHASGSGRVMSPFAQTQLPPPPPPQFVANGDMGQMMALPPHPSALAYAGPQPLYFAPAPGGYTGRGMEMTPELSNDGLSLAPAPDINGMGLPPSGQEMYIDQYGQPHPTAMPSQYIVNGEEQPPAKRQRSEEYVNGTEQQGAAAEADESMQQGEEDEDEDFESRSRPPLPSSMRLATRPTRPRQSAESERIRNKLLSLFQADSTPDVRTIFGLPEGHHPDFDIDTVIDAHGHTALHWACAMAKMAVIEQLIALGADIHRGNFAGETPLIRSVLTTNHAEEGTFPQLLTLLAPSIRTLDQAYRSVIHHIGLVAGIRGRASAARTYMVGVLDWVAREQKEAAGGGGVDMSLKNLVDVQDLHGDTALIISARVGNKGLVQLLLDAGADKAKANKLGLRAQDFGLDVESLRVSPAEAVVGSLKSDVIKPERRSRDVQKNIAAMFETVNATFDTEMTKKQTALNTTEQNVRHATKALAERRQQVSKLQAKIDEMAQLSQKSENIRRSLATPPSPRAWTGRTTGNPSPAFRELSAPVNPTFTGGEEIQLPERGAQGAVETLRRLAAWEDRVAQVLEEKIRALEGESADKAVKYRRLVSLCTKVPVEQVDGMLDGLTRSVESDGSSIDQTRMSSLLSRIRG